MRCDFRKAPRLPAFYFAVGLLAVTGGLTFSVESIAADANPAIAAAKPQPKVLLAIPLGMAAGTTKKIVIRGSLLDGATEVKFPDSRITAKILSKGKANLPDKADPKRSAISRWKWK